MAMSNDQNLPGGSLASRASATAIGLASTCMCTVAHATQHEHAQRVRLQATFDSDALSWLFELRLSDALSLHTAGSGPCGGLKLYDLLFFSVIGFGLLAIVRLRYAHAQKRIDLARRMVEQGIEPPADLVGGGQRSDLRRGVVLVFAGLGLLSASFATGHQQLLPAGLIPGFIGMGYLMSHWLTCGSSKGSS